MLRNQGITQSASNSWPHGMSVDWVVRIWKEILHYGPSSADTIWEVGPGGVVPGAVLSNVI
jgi:hypothetical protein